MSIIPLTTELMIREHTRKTILREIRKKLLRQAILKEGGEVGSRTDTSVDQPNKKGDSDQIQDTEPIVTGKH